MATAASVINLVRDQIPDPVYDGAGLPQPDSDGGLVRATTLYQHLSNALTEAAIKTDWRTIDWTAVPVTQFLPNYAIDEKWQEIDEAWHNGWRLGRTGEGNVIWPNNVQSGQGVVYGIHNVTTGIEMRLYPAPDLSDPATTTVGAITAIDTTISVTDVTRFNSYGYIKIGSELIQYHNISGTTLQGCVRGVGATTAAAASSGAAVTHCSLWVRGRRTPKLVTLSTDVLELPLSWHPMLQLYVLAKVREQEQEYQRASQLMQEFNQECQRLLLDPKTKAHQGLQVKAYGESVWGPLAWGRAVVN